MSTSGCRVLTSAYTRTHAHVCVCVCLQSQNVRVGHNLESEAGVLHLDLANRGSLPYHRVTLAPSHLRAICGLLTALAHSKDLLSPSS